MLISFTLKNWKSFKDSIELTMKATKGKRHHETLSRIKKYPLRLLPVSVIFGLNATGKSNLIDALSFAKKFITNPTFTFNAENPMGYVPFKLDDASSQKETYFSFEILVDEKVCHYAFSLLNNNIKEENLDIIFSHKTVNIYKRVEQEIVFGEIIKSNQKKKEFSHFLKQNLFDKILLLTYAVRENVAELNPIYNWFEKQLQIIKPDSGFTNWINLVNKSDDLAKALNSILCRLETGIDYLALEEHDQNTKPKAIHLNQRQAETIPQIVPPKLRPVLNSNPTKQVWQELVSLHKSLGGKEIQFALRDESSGTKRLISLIPAFYQLVSPSENVVYAIDDFDRNLHSNLTQFLIQYFLDGCNKDNRSQLIFSTHDLTLLNLDLFRTDEIWLTERNYDGSTGILPLSLYSEISKDKNLINSYRDGRFCNTPTYNLINPKLL